MEIPPLAIDHPVHVLPRMRGASSVPRAATVPAVHGPQGAGTIALPSLDGPCNDGTALQLLLQGLRLQHKTAPKHTHLGPGVCLAGACGFPDLTLADVGRAKWWSYDGADFD
jgi:hypothetical protein